jgi:DNA-binding MarR family transcriptional regulator
VSREGAVTETWTDREQRMLEVIRDAEEAGEEATLALLIDRLDLDEGMVKLTLRRLLEAGYVDATVMSAWQSEMVSAREIKLLERGLRQVAVWPSEDPYTALVDLLEAQLEAETEPEKRSKIQALLAGVKTAGREVVINLGTAWIRQQMGLP